MAKLPTRFIVKKRLVSASTGRVARPGEVVGVDDFLAPCGDEDINLLLKRGAIVAAPDERKDKKTSEDES